jgi:hypothetical protein
MKLPIGILFLLLIYHACLASPPKSKDDFLGAVRAAYEAKDATQIHELTWEKGISGYDRDIRDQWLQKVFKLGTGVEKISLGPLADHHREAKYYSGRRWESTFPPAGAVKITLKPIAPNTSESLSMPYAVIDGAYYLVTIKSTDIGWKGPQDRPFIVILEGVGQDKVKFDLKYNASGIDQEIDVAHGLVCQSISEAIVTSVDDDVDVKLRILDGSKTICDSELKGKGKIIYEKGY